MDTLKEKYTFSYKPELLRLFGLRDFICLLLSYPVKLEEEGIFKEWTNAFPKWRARLLTAISSDEHGVIDKPWWVLTERALRCMEGFLPIEMISQIRHNGRIFFNRNGAIPEAILDLTVDLAAGQLIQTLFSIDDFAPNTRYIRLSTKNFDEKRSALSKIAAALEDKHMKFGIDKDFLRVIWIDASTYDGDSEVRVQEEINKMVGVVTEEMTGNRYLVILVDRDSDKKLDPRNVLLPAGTVLLITTEPLAQAQEGDEFAIACTIDLNIRTQDHLLSWEVFCSHAGSVMIHSSRAIQEIAERIVKECHGHLLAIVLVAKSLKNAKDVKQWELAFAKLIHTNPSYDYLESDQIGISRAMVNAFVNIIWADINKMQKLFLEASSFVYNIKSGVPGGTFTSTWVNAKLLHTPEATYSMRRLLDCSVLLRCKGDNVRLPIEIYDMIVSLHKLYPSIIRNGALGLTEPPHVGQWHGLIQLELMNNEISELPQSPYCPELRVLLLQGNADLMDIPDSFFNHMPLLICLDLSYTSIRDLPPSISNLKELKNFYLRGCDLFMELTPEIGQLKNLEELDLDGTFITYLPEYIGKLINLKRLTLCFERYHHGKKGNQISNSTLIPLGVISNLVQLNYLSINVDPEDERWDENVLGILVEILELEMLKWVSIYIPKVDIMDFIPPHKSLDFRLVVGHHMQRFISRVIPEVEEQFKYNDSSIKFVNGVSVPNGVKINLSRFKALYLDRHMTLKSLSEFHLKNLNMLQLCILAECNEMETVFDASSSDNDQVNILAECNEMETVVDTNDCLVLESLNVFYMKNLRSICEGTPLHCLKSLRLHTCPMLTTIFSLSFIHSLSVLEELIIEDCPKVTTLISHHLSEHEAHIFLPRLRMISLLYLPALVSIFNGFHVEHGLEKMGFYYCPKLQTLSKSELSSKRSLRVIKGESKWWEALKWNEAEWGCADQPSFLDQIFSPINEEADIMTQLAARDYEDQYERERKQFVPPPLILNNELRKSRKRTRETRPVIFQYNNPSEFWKAVERLTGVPSGNIGDTCLTGVPSVNVGDTSDTSALTDCLRDMEVE
ncbi:disease resistance protein RPS2-like [Lotus japonicus]|uniref:disease resistance protein RPS2-like n=1 Tax=Lotus japonicus TaxID=34305 RepID=UPI0025856620|nr:disease resistance protein RPS2-like [Lotus japonicus]XP_057420988.1 disease resistance protein RPS2-like [Lotus japonicus]XP_057420989.1 disease resistance protein RPS2-like [Lotus japonicus]XP_057420990.1 disease resistance protein RPS2-like [Lotus japonicus]